MTIGIVYFIKDSLNVYKLISKKQFEKVSVLSKHPSGLENNTAQ